MYNLIEYSSNYFDATGSLWFYSKDEATKFDTDITSTNASKSFEYKVKLLENTVTDSANGIFRTTTVTTPLKYLSKFWRSLEMPLINCRVDLKLRWVSHCVLASAGVENNNADSNNITFTIKDTKPIQNAIQKI